MSECARAVVTIVLWLGHAGKGLSREDRCLPWSGWERELVRW